MKTTLASLLIIAGTLLIIKSYGVSEEVQEISSSSVLQSLPFAEVIIAQGLLESNYFSSAIFKENNNWLGLKCAEFRSTYCTGTNRGHAVFSSTTDCLLDYIEWQKKYLPRYEKNFGQVDSVDRYIDFLVKYRYAEDPHYGSKLKRLLPLARLLLKKN